MFHTVVNAQESIPLEFAIPAAVILSVAYFVMGSRDRRVRRLVKKVAK